MTNPIRVTVWGENRHEQREPEVAERYPDGMHGAVASAVREHLGDGAVHAVRVALGDLGLELLVAVLAPDGDADRGGHGSTPRT